MASFNPKKVAFDIADGLVCLNPTVIKRYTVDELKALLGHLTVAQREIRATNIPLDQLLEIGAKNRQLQRIHSTLAMINAHAKKYRLHL